MTVLVTGGAGYIGSVVVDLLRDRGEAVVVLDDLSGGHRDAVDADLPFFEGAVGDRALLEQILARFAPEACLHFAGLISVAESVREPERYRARNVGESSVLIETLAGRVRHLVFSSSAAVYGEPERVPIDEGHPLRPTSPYGHTKLAVEELLSDAATADRLQAVSLRYFNAAGAAGRRSERHEPETHLIPLVLRAAAAGEAVRVFGSDYPTPDGTAVRDYIHVADLGEAHLLALDHLRAGGSTAAVNLGNGRGFSVRQVIEVARRVTGVDIRVEDAARRPGDPAVLVADTARAARLLGWRPMRPDLEDIVASAWRALPG